MSLPQIEKFLTGNKDRTHVCTIDGQGLEHGRLQPHCAMLIDIARQLTAPVKTVQDVLKMHWGDRVRQLCGRLPAVTKLKLVKSALTIPVASGTSERSLSCLRRV